MTSGAQSSIAASNQAPILTGAAGRYAEALFDLAKEAASVDVVESNLNDLAAAIQASSEFKEALLSPVYGRSDKAAAIGAVADRMNFIPLTKNFLGLLGRNGRLFDLAAIIDAYRELAAYHRGEVKAEVVSASPLSDEQQKRLRGEIEGLVGKAVNLAAKVDPNLLAGLVVKVGSTMIDSSLRTKLNKLKSAMKEA